MGTGAGGTDADVDRAEALVCLGSVAGGVERYSAVLCALVVRRVDEDDVGSAIVERGKSDD